MLHQVALVNGISMGGGAALMIPLKFSVVTEKTVSFFVSYKQIIYLNPFLVLWCNCQCISILRFKNKTFFDRSLPLLKQVLDFILIVVSHTTILVCRGIQVVTTISGKKIHLVFCSELHRKLERLFHVYTGEYLALTGARLNGKELVAAGLATHLVSSEVWLCSLLTYACIIIDT